MSMNVLVSLMNPWGWQVEEVWSGMCCGAHNGTLRASDLRRVINLEVVFVGVDVTTVSDGEMVNMKIAIGAVYATASMLERCVAGMVWLPC